MDISKLLEEPLIISSDDSVSRVASAMLSKRRHEAVVMDNGSFKGVVTAEDVIGKSVTNPETTKISSLVRSVETAFPETSIDDAVNSILINNFKSLPVETYKDGKMFIVTKTALVKALMNEPILKDKTASDVMSFPYCVSRDDSIMTARSIMRDMGVSVIPVVNESKVEGMIEDVDLLGLSTHGMQRTGRGEGAGEKRSSKNVLASSMMQKDVLKVESGTPLSKVAGLLASARVPAVIIEEKGKLAGMVTPRDILKLFGGQREGVYVTINGIQEEDDFIKSVVDEEIGNAVRKLAKITPIQYFVINVKKYNEDGKRIKYSIKSRLVTNKGAFFAHDFAWDMTKAVRGMLHKLEKEMLKRSEKAPASGKSGK